MRQTQNPFGFMEGAWSEIYSYNIDPVQLLLGDKPVPQRNEQVIENIRMKRKLQNIKGKVNNLSLPFKYKSEVEKILKIKEKF